ncbi:MAG TPA: metal-dependent hydrolase, partial [Turneriella sp.]|nr:metal-dependent hydrolase [Turneriella sp.]
MTAAAENMTGGFAQSLFAPGQAERILREDVRELYLWHAAEEMEHRDLAYDVFEKVSGDYPTRVLAMVLTYGIISGYVAVGTAYLMFTDREFPWAKLPKQAWDLFTQENAIGRVFLEGMIDYLRPDFHPSQHPMHQGALEYLAKFEKAAS